MEYKPYAWRLLRAALYGAVGSVAAALAGLPQTPTIVLAIGLFNALEHYLKSE